MNESLNSVSVVIPCYNEEQHIQAVLHAILCQSYPAECLEIVIADGKSTDRTIAEIEAFRGNHSDLNIVVISNPRRNIPSALNMAIRASHGEIIVRMDAHTLPENNYIQLCVENLHTKDVQNTGGLWVIQPGNESWMAKSIALAASHPLGAGDAKYRYSQKEGFVETVPFGAFRRSLFDQIGFFDESLLTNEDYEFNTRIIKAGGKIFYDPRIRSNYIARGSLKDLSRQYGRYGFWKQKMLKKYPDTLRLRQALPPLFVVMLILSILIALFEPVVFLFLVALLFVYFGILLAASFPIAKKNHDMRLLIGIPIAISTMHLFWGSGFLASLLSGNKGYN